MLKKKIESIKDTILEDFKLYLFNEGRIASPDDSNEDRISKIKHFYRYKITSSFLLIPISDNLYNKLEAILSRYKDTLYNPFDFIVSKMNSKSVKEYQIDIDTSNINSDIDMEYKNKVKVENSKFKDIKNTQKIYITNNKKYLKINLYLYDLNYLDYTRYMQTVLKSNGNVLNITGRKANPYLTTTIIAFNTIEAPWIDIYKDIFNFIIDHKLEPYSIYINAASVGEIIIDNLYLYKQISFQEKISFAYSTIQLPFVIGLADNI